MATTVVPLRRERDPLPKLQRLVGAIVAAPNGWVAVFSSHGGHTTIRPIVAWGLVNWVDPNGDFHGVEHLVPMCVDSSSGLASDALRDVHFLGVEQASHKDATAWIEAAKQAVEWIRNRPHQTPPCGCQSSRPEICVMVTGPTDSSHARCDCACHPRHLCEP